MPEPANANGGGHAYAMTEVDIQGLTLRTTLAAFEGAAAMLRQYGEERAAELLDRAVGLYRDVTARPSNNGSRK